METRGKYSYLLLIKISQDFYLQDPILSESEIQKIGLLFKSLYEVYITFAVYLERVNSNVLYVMSP